MKTLCKFALAASCLLTCSLVHAYKYRSCNGNPITWFNSNTVLSISTTNFPEGSFFEQHIQYMMYEWNDVVGSQMMLYVGRDTDGQHFLGNNVNEVYIEDLGENILGVARYLEPCLPIVGNPTNIREVDIAMNSKLNWSADGFQGVMLHEIGHALGFNHTDKLAIMNDGFKSEMHPKDNSRAVGHINKVTPLADERSGIRFLYPNGEIARNLTANRFRVDSSGEKLKNEPAPSSLSTGGTFSVNYTIQNAGSVTENSVVVHFYLTASDLITSSDRFLGAAAWNMPPGSSVEALTSFTIPSDLPPGRYYVAYMVDPDNSIPERTENDNSVVLEHDILVN